MPTNLTQPLIAQKRVRTNSTMHTGGNMCFATVPRSSTSLLHSRCCRSRKNGIYCHLLDVRLTAYKSIHVDGTRWMKIRTWLFWL